MTFRRKTKHYSHIFPARVVALVGAAARGNSGNNLSQLATEFGTPQEFYGNRMFLGLERSVEEGRT